ncbi:hypothetical protein SteCoe_35068 [Stentor coeruleus]|uniref:Uncharacterized protein n=1 Tax=Stentor coeruleus TaxID=5963 RepID=A0A1R2AT61_9CILI|nr:hypothetical protein SteCoe_35068 [Stentor coeruleus]
MPINLTGDPPKLHIYIYLASALILAAFCVIDLALHEWFEYCYWHIGLVYAESSTDNYLFSGESSISHVYYDACDKSDTLKNAMQTFCPDLCDNLTNFRIAGGLMITFSILTLLSFIVVIGMHCMLLFKKQPNFKFAWMLMILPLMTYMLGFIIYRSITDTGVIKVTKNLSGFTDPKDFEWKGGMIFAVIIIIFMGFNLIHGMIFTRKILLVDNRI